MAAFALANGAADFVAMPHARAPDAAATARLEIAANASAEVVHAGAEVREAHAEHADGAAGEAIGPPVGINAEIHLR